MPQTQPACLNDSATGLIDCGNWNVSASWTVPATATSGIYFANAVRTDTGEIRCEQLVLAAGPWIRDLWAMLELPDRVPVTGPDGTVHPDQPMWTYWALQEGTLAIEPAEFTDNRGAFPPVTHVDSDVPLYDDISGDLITDQMWGIYYKPDFYFAGLRGGSSPYVVGKPAGAVESLEAVVDLVPHALEILAGGSHPAE